MLRIQTGNPVGFALKRNLTMVNIGYCYSIIEEGRRISGEVIGITPERKYRVQWSDGEITEEDLVDERVSLVL
jgi:hypothetical protein